MNIQTTDSFIEINKEIRFNNVISFRKKVGPSEIKNEIDQITEFIKSKEVNIIGPMISATFSAELLGGNQVLDMEVQFPIDKKIEGTSEYTFKEEFHLVNAVYTRYQGDPSQVQSVYNDLVSFIRSNNLQQITVAYTINLKANKPLEYPIFDIYIGVNPSKL